MVALKVIRPDLARNRAILDRFKQELILATQVTDRNVVRIYDLGEAEGIKFITMEYVEGEDLAHILHQRTKLPPHEAVIVIEQVCRALAAAHNVGVIHRDLKPQNIMWETASGRILVMDFGLAKTLEGDRMTQTGAMVGTMEYMSPEQALAANPGPTLRHLFPGTHFLRVADRANALPRRQRSGQPDQTNPGARGPRLGIRQQRPR